MLKQNAKKNTLYNNIFKDFLRFKKRRLIMPISFFN